ncbi:MAG: RidA family protein [Phycisphaerales bacterium]
MKPAEIQRIWSGAPWEKKYGYCRAIRVDDRAFTAGTLAIAEDGKGIHGPDDVYAQTIRCFAIALDALRNLGVEPSGVVRSRMYVVNIQQNQDAVGRAHGETFQSNPPCATMVEVSGLAHPDALVEIELEAYIARETD